MSEYDAYKVLQATCPKCGAEADEKCKAKSGRPSDFHTARKGVVYERYRNRQGVGSPTSKRSKLRKAVIAAAMDWSGQNGPHPMDEARAPVSTLIEACQALAAHRAKHPGVPG